ncbi:receptor-type tyrosine-protein phosphatase H-like isoform X2 [Notolabrus celidotus]|uniref:receptor-type tyrosine-protein phosphatase H-like isoform X2 n=1 Tax=Notolabrus celidotus TaxID=1203425 RepID=UPI00149003E0|nr:receptor-type tyrosine-protein phosphatase H-like isoform X2 [Notolabrus celidotus]XP_034563693.1 receptor-type tyrosine-protein phosphatase H-like isoform X2 [Notolabrus celidotus]XP_034563694.1 receptor-type tyrosine-protein phosphatase H-like isoform X2 [Notolabrus celidotus]XP_034563695.1 receptor-type tyrosine-protein phosphatase H-like isoform X2 [Notolabrus celidotus]XP_034563696.1 receptor-type tyrosine-protein phosphatase H-like isoform X2 [Notolabrus celidotus]XP_034563697.1 recep
MLHEDQHLHQVVTDTNAQSAKDTSTLAVETVTTQKATTQPTTILTTTGPPDNVQEVEVTKQSETSITLTWDKVNNISTYFLKYEHNGAKETFINDTSGGSISFEVTPLTAGRRYSFTVITTFNAANSTGTTADTFSAPRNAEEITVVGQSESSITLQWKKVDELLDYIFVVNGSEINVTALDGEDTVTYTVSGLQSGTEYEFDLFTVFENIRSSGVKYTAVTAPLNTDQLRSVEQTETSITLQWTKVNGSFDYTLVYHENEINISASKGHEVTVKNLTNTTRYNFTLFTVFENVRSSGVTIMAPTAPPNPGGLKIVGQNDTSITLQWNKVENLLNYKLKVDELEVEVLAVAGQVLVTKTFDQLESGTKHSFSLFALYHHVRSSGLNISAVTAPRNAEEITVVGQSESSITLQWKKVDELLDYIFVVNGSEINVTALDGEDTVTYTVSGLQSGTEYEFDLFTVFENIRSSGVKYTAVTAPLNTDQLRSVEQTETSITLQWTKVNGSFDYTLVYHENEINISASKGHEVTVKNLTNTTRYNFTLFTVFENVRSSGVTIMAPTAPPNTEELNVFGQNETSITLQWKKVGAILEYRIVFDSREIVVLASAEDKRVSDQILGLESGTKYDFRVFALFENVRSSGRNFITATVPSMVASVNVTERSVDSVTLVWKSVRKDWSYSLKINGKVFNHKGSQDVLSQVISSLKPGTEYPFSVSTGFFGLNSTAYEDFTVTAINCANVNWHVTNSSIKGTIEGLFTNATATNKSQTHVSSEDGIVSFTGLYPGATYEVYLEYEKNSIHFNQCSHAVTIIPPDIKPHCEYWASGYSVYIAWDTLAGIWTGVKVKVNGETHSSNNREQHVIIPGFQPAKTYAMSVVTLSGERSSAPFAFQCSTDPRGVIAGSVMGVLLFLVLVCLAAFILLKRPDLISQSFIGGTKQTNKKPKAISVTKFADHVYHLSADENRGFSQEYESLMPVGTEQTRKDANLPENKPRNRFNNVLPYDWCRVKLTSSGAIGMPDYINANYMPGYNNNREYIATQGPLPSTINDFWRMIWEQRVKGIVMVTNCKESGKTKCEQYWPEDRKPCLFGEFAVTLRSEKKELYWTLREFMLKHKNYSEERTVKHFHFTAWPDHGVPQGTQVLIQFRGLVRQHIEREGTGAPTVVHCSAGVGRTGTIIALDVLLQQLEKERAVGINAFVHKMRLSRPHMVQTESQYVFLHQCIMDTLQQNEKSEENIYENDDMMYVNATALREFNNGSQA